MIDAAPNAAGNFALLLAAGEGSRFGGGKLTALWRGEPLVCAAARAALAGPFEELIAITGSDAGTVEAALAELCDERVSIVHNPDWREGMARSLLCGLAALPARAERVAVFLGDMPLVDPALAAILLSRIGRAPAALASSGKQPLHPVVIARSAFPLLANLSGEKGARSILYNVEGSVHIEHDRPLSALDIDRPADLERCRDL